MLQKMTWIVSITHYIFNKLTGGLPTIVMVYDTAKSAKKAVNRDNMCGV